MRKVFKRTQDLDEEEDIIGIGLAAVISIIFSIAVFILTR